MPEDQQEAARQQAFQAQVERLTPPPPLAVNCSWAFVVGGGICVVGQMINDFFQQHGFNAKDAAAYTTAVLVFGGALLTGLGVYDRLGQKAGAGSIVPITGFANSIVAPAMEFKREGYVLGLGGKMFVVAGPVLVYGMVTAFFIGLLHWLTK